MQHREKIAAWPMRLATSSQSRRRAWPHMKTVAVTAAKSAVPSMRTRLIARLCAAAEACGLPAQRYGLAGWDHRKVDWRKRPGDPLQGEPGIEDRIDQPGAIRATDRKEPGHRGTAEIGIHKEHARL